MMNITILPFEALDLDTFYEILALRSNVFIVEQACFYQDLDFKDQHAMHLQIREDDRLIGYARILPYDDHAMSFGRIVTAPSHRGQGLGKQLMEIILGFLGNHYPERPITITAQNYLHDFYQGYGFNAQGEPFDMDGIPHITMVKQP
ncbi:GNAT family N-acetyltransferase [Legionella spiritensis]|uniref:GNAT family N-acetyltransferase n=1 Tax=Legionella spiritensis TaxID=452 RepID=UPI000F701C57|nr:GNAT family N-acetyltransferase [Legionella spiritensis]VEG92058.1 acyltransferase [Legionella spiritensis]